MPWFIKQLQAKDPGHMATARKYTYSIFSKVIVLSRLLLRNAA
jgi:hypothetical protein